MGLPMATRLVDAGYEVVFSSRRSGAIESLTARGATSLPTPLIVAEQSRILLSCLPSDRELAEVFLGPAGAVEHLEPGATIIDFSTASPMIIQQIAREANERDLRVLDAPVSGGVYGAEQGILTMMVGGDPEVLETVRPILDVMGEQIIHVGGVGMGKVFKTINQMLAGSTMVLVGEALSLAAQAGADLNLLYDVVSASSGGSRVWSDIVPKLIGQPDENPGFRLDLMRKDMTLAEMLGADLGTPLPLTVQALQFYTAAMAHGRGKQGAHEIAEMVARFAGADLRSRPEDVVDDSN